MVPVVPGVALEFLGRGGDGGVPVVLLAGQGNTACTFGDFSPRLTDRFHEVALMRRGAASPARPRLGARAAGEEGVLKKRKARNLSVPGLSSGEEYGT
ncbi:hypothetical protein HJC10_01285 [Corallococcus exiguus]|nr:hypothetical protein [Corallococcus exiguus]